jgi:hypothetical protein
MPCRGVTPPPGGRCAETPADLGAGLLATFDIKPSTIANDIQLSSTARVRPTALEPWSEVRTFYAQGYFLTIQYRIST